MVLNSSSSMKAHTQHIHTSFEYNSRKLFDLKQIGISSNTLLTPLRDHLVQLSFCRWECWGPTKTRPQTDPCLLHLMITQCIVSTSSQGMQQFTQTTRLCLSSLTGFRIKLASNLRSKAIWSISIPFLPHLECNWGKVSWEVNLGPPPRTKQSDRGQISAVLCLKLFVGPGRHQGTLIIVFLPESFGQKNMQCLGIWYLLLFWRWEMGEMRAERKWSVKGSMLLFRC